MTRQLPVAALLAGAAIAVGISLFKLVWYRATILDLPIEIQFLAPNTPGISDRGGVYGWVSLTAGLASMYYALRLTFMTVTVIAGKPVNDTVAWIAPWSAYLQGGIVLALASATALVTPEVAISGTDFTADDVTRDWTAYIVLVGGLVVALVGTVIVARTPDLAAAQGWGPVATTADELAPEPAEPARRERPMTRPPPMQVAAVDANPMRAPPANDLRARTVKTARAAEAPPVVDDPDAPKPKFLG